MMHGAPDRRPLLAAGLLLGAGLGGFVDGILFHQILQWHSMLSASYPTFASPSWADQGPLVLKRNVEVNMFWDGLFHAGAWAMTALGLLLLFRAGRRADVPWSGRSLAGAMACGCGLFNFAEGLLDHHVLHLHHVRESLGVSAWDYAFLASGLALMALGGLLIRAGRGNVTPRASRVGEVGTLADAPLVRNVPSAG